MSSFVYRRYHDWMQDEVKTSLVVLGPTASGKTSLGVALAKVHGGEVISADSRQVYIELNVGSGKDLHEYSTGDFSVPYHLIDIVDLDREFSVFEFQKRFFQVYADLQNRNVMPVIVGGTGLYLEAVLSGYTMVEVPEDSRLRAELSSYGQDELVERLRTLKPRLHNSTDLGDRDRLIRAIEIEVYSASHVPVPTPKLTALIIGAKWERKELHERIRTRLRERFEAGMIEEVEDLLNAGVPVKRLRLLGLEYRFIADYLEGDILNRIDLFNKLNSSIRNFAKRQETWFRRMERNGADIHWIEGANINDALALTARVLPLAESP